MLIELALATLMVLLTALIHLVGLAVLTRLLRSHSRIMSRLRIMPISVLIGAAIGIIAVHTAEIWTWAALYSYGLGTFDHFEQALYFSTQTYASIGYGDVLMPERWRILGAIEGAAGIIMFGWSTAFLLSLLTQLKLLGHDWLGGDSNR